MLTLSMLARSASATAIVLASAAAAPILAQAAPIGFVHAAPLQPAAGHHALRRGLCVPKIWASDLANNAVYGYTTGGSLPCITLTGSSAPDAALAFNAPFGLATDPSGNLYVADLNNQRIVVFNSIGNDIKVLYTTLGLNAGQPFSVCVGKVAGQGVIGVANRAYNGSGASNSVFFPIGAPDLSFPNDYANSSSMTNANFCAFDKKGNYFVDGNNGTTQEVDYLPRGKVAIAALGVSPPPQALTYSAAIGTGAYWLGMYSRKDGNDTLSVAQTPTTSCGTYCETITTWQVAGPAMGPLTFTSPGTCSVQNYPNNYDAVYQVAPDTNGNLYFADYWPWFNVGSYYSGTVNIAKPCQLGTTLTGGGTYEWLNNAGSPIMPIGVALNKTGQY